MILGNICIKLRIICFILVAKSAAAENEVPTTFGLITVTHARAGDNSQFMKYLKRYAFMQCPIINQISIIWNNEKSMEEIGIFAERDQWKIPIYFYTTQYNSMYWRYNIPKQTKSQIFFSIDDDIIITCEELMKGFEVWRKNAIGNLGPIVTYEARFFQYTVERGFQYGKKKQRNYFNIGLNIAFISRHFLQLYYADIWELSQLKKHILKKNNCDDIALNWIIQYYYPQLPTIVIQGDVQNKSPAVAQSTTSSHFEFRNQCLKDFTDIFGLNPLRYIRIQDKYPNRQKKLTPLIRQVVLAKQKYLNKYILSKQSSFQAISAIANEKKNDQTQKTEKFSLQMRRQYQIRLVKLSQKQQELLQELQNNNTTSNQPELIAKLKKKIQYEQLLGKQLIQKHYWRSYLDLALCLLFAYVLWRFCQLSDSEKSKPKNLRLESNEIQTQSQSLKS